MKKVSELNTDAALDVLCEITPYVNNIVIDEDLIAELKRKLDPGQGKSRAEILRFGAEKLNSIAPLLLKTHRGDIYGILSVLAGKSREDISRQNIIETSIQLRTLLKDREMLDFFKSCVEQEQTG